VSHYDDLGISQSASPEQIHKAYNDLALKYHPDTYKGADKDAAVKEFKRIHTAYLILRNPTSRAEYDAALWRAEHPNSSQRKARPDSGGRATAPKPHPPSGFLQKLAQFLASKAWRKPRFIFAAIGVFFLLVTAIVSVASRPPSQAEIDQKEQKENELKIAKNDRKTKLAASEGEVKNAESKKAKDDAQRTYESSVAKTKLGAAQTESDNALTLVARLEGELASWTKNIGSLLDDPRGQKIAANEDRIDAFEIAWNKMRISEGAASDFRTQIKTLMSPVEAQLDKEQPLLAPDPNIIKQLESIEASIQQSIDEVKQSRFPIERLVERAEREGKSSPLKLRAAIADLAARRAEEKTLKALAVEKAASRQEEKDNARLEETKMAARKRVVEDQLAKEKDSASDAIKKKELEARAGSQETRTLLAYFLARGYVQPDGTQTTEKRPISFSKLDAKGCLEDTPDGQEKLLIYALTNRNEELRPKWSDSPAIRLLTDERRQKLVEVQKALIELGPTLVELKLLDP